MKALPTVARPVWVQVLVLTWPVLIQQWLIISVMLFDRILAGRFQDVTAEEQLASQAAQTTANYLSWLISCFSVLVSAGATALVARLTGAGEHDRAVHATNQALTLAVVLGVVGTLLGMAGLPTLVNLLHLEGIAARDALAYLTPLVLFLTFQIVESAGIACLVGAGDTRTGLWVLGGVAVVNVPLTILCFRGLGPIPKLGFEGIAWGTALAHTAGALAVLGLLWRGWSGLRIVPALLRPNFALLGRLLAVSVPSAADSFSIMAAQLWFLSLVNRLDQAAASAHGIALTWEAWAYQSGAAFGVAAMTLVGQYLGARRPDLAAWSAWTAYGMGCAVMGVMGVCFFSFGREMFELVCPLPSQQPIVDAGVPVLGMIALVMPALAATMIFTQALRGAGDTLLPVVFTWVGFLVVRIPLAYWLTGSEMHLGLRGAWLAMCADLIVRGCFFFARFASGRWKTKKV